VPPRHEEHPKEIMAWLAALPKPCGVFACCDAWARIVGRYAQVSGLRIPEDIALVGVDNDAVECETMAPPLSSVALPWRSVGESAANLVQLGLRGKAIAATRVLVAPVDVVVRRSSDTFALADEPLVAAAVRWIREHSGERVSVPMVARAVGATRQRLERHFRRALGHTVLREIHRAHVEVARRLLATTDVPLAQVAKSSGFTNVALLSVAFRREVGVPPGAYRRSARGLFAAGDE
jgi:LacI family transcriptional regulator